MHNLQSLLRFNSSTGHIWLDEQRMLLMHTRALASLRKELFDSLGVERARGLLVRMGFASGKYDGELAVKRRRAGTRTEEAFLLGPQLHSLEGVVHVEKVALELHLGSGHFFGEFLWENSWEDDANIADFGFGEDPACWTQIGYASGYTSAFMGRLVVFKEVECRSQGDARCRIIGQPADEWHDEAYLDYFRPQAFGQQLIEYNVGLEQVRTAQVRRGNDGKLVGASSGFRAAFDLLRTAANSTINVLLLGETGVGKEMFAQWLHDNGPRKDGPFIAVNCAAIPAELIEAELFGVEKGAYTGAHFARAGRFERASGGTLFLDEIGDLPASAQVKLLRALQTREIERLGANQTTKIDVRIVAATHVDLQRAVNEGRFRADLFYRLNAYPVTIPPLRERAADIPPLIERFLEKYTAMYAKTLHGLTDKALRETLTYPWPGNIRELENVVERAVLLAPDDGSVEACHLFGEHRHAESAEKRLDGHGTLVEAGVHTLDRVCGEVLGSSIDLPSLEQHLMSTAMQRASGNLTKAAKLLGITRPQLAYRLKKEGMRTA